MKHLTLGILSIMVPTMLLAQEVTQEKQTARSQADEIFQKLMEQDTSSPKKNENQAPISQDDKQLKPIPPAQEQAQPAEKKNQPQAAQPVASKEKSEDAITPLQLQEMLRASIKQEIKIPDESQRQYNDKQLSEQVKNFLRLSLPERLIDVVVDTRYIVQLVPIVKKSSQLKKIKLPGFENYVWTPTFKNHNLSFSYQTKPYRTYFVFLNGPKTLVNYDLLKKRIAKIDPATDWENRDLLRMINVSYEIPHQKTAFPSQTTEAQSEKEALKIEPKLPTPLSWEEQLERERKFSKHLLNARNDFFKDNLDEALDNLIEAIKFNPKSAQAYEMLGSVYYRLGWKEKALHYWNKSLELYPNNNTLRKYYDNLKRSP